MTTNLDTLMPCHEVVALLWEYLDGELDDAMRARIREHRDHCHHCTDHFTFEGAFLRTVTRVIDEPCETGALRQRILTALREEGHERTRK
jgi:mycothiol system anti-sigma-R factor